MSTNVNQVGLSAVFETAEFMRGVATYIGGSNQVRVATAQTAAAINATRLDVGQMFENIGSRFNQVAERMRNAATQMKFDVPSPLDADDLAVADEMLLHFTRLQSAVTDRIRLEQLLQQEQSVTLSQLEQQRITLEKNAIFARQAIRAGEEAESPFGDPVALNRINQAGVSILDTGDKILAKDQKIAATLELQAEEMRAQIELGRLLQVVNSKTASDAEKFLASRRQQTLDFETQARRARAKEQGIDLGFVKDISIEPPKTSVAEADLRFNQLVLEAIRDRRKALELENQLKQRGVQGTLEELRLRNELNALADRAAKRSEEGTDLAAGLGVTPADLDAIAKATKDQLGQQIADSERVAQQQRIILAEVENRIRAEERLQQSQGATLSSLQQEQEVARRLAESIEAASRREQFQELGGDPAVIDGIRKAAVDLEKLSASRLTQAQREAEMHSIISTEIEDRIRDEQNSATLKRTDLTVLEKQRAELEKQQRSIERASRSARFEALGGNRLELTKIRTTPVVDQDLKQGTTELQKQVRITSLLAEEMRDVVELIKSKRAIQSYATTAVQKHNASIKIMTIETARARREAELLALGFNRVDLEKLRATSVTMRDLGNTSARTAKNTEKFTKQLSAGTVALGVGVVVAIRSAINWLSRMGQGIIENVTFFERLELSIEFFSVRAARAKNEALSYGNALSLVAAEAQGTVIWLQRLAVASPFTAQQVGTLFRVAQAYGLTRNEAVQITPLLLDFAAAAGLSGDVLERLALALGQVRARGKLTGEEVRQLGNSGLPIRDILVKALGIANNEFDKLLESGELTSNVVIPHIIKALRDFEGAGRRVAFETLGGIINAFKEVGQISSFQFFKGVTDVVKEEFLGLFDAINSTETLTFLRVLGQEIGVRLANAMQGLRDSIGSLLEIYDKLTPAQRRLIIGFGIGAAAVTMLTVQLGLLILGLNLLLKPFILIPTLIAAAVGVWGAGFKGMADSVVELGNLVTTVFGQISEAFIALFTGKSNRARPNIGQVSEDMVIAYGKANEEIVNDNKDALDTMTGNALIAGKAGGQAFYEGWQIPNPAKKISEEMAEALRQLGRGRELSQAGTAIFNGISRTIAEGDFGFLDSIAGQISRFLATRVSLGEIVDADVPRGIFRLREALSQALNEFRTIGSVGPNSLNKLRAVAGPLGDDVVAMVNAYVRLTPEVEAVEAAQRQLNEISERYKAILTPIRKELEKISDARKELSEDREIRALQRVIENEAAGVTRKREAQLGIEEIILQRQLRTTEALRDAETEIVEEKRDAASKRVDEFRKEFDLLKAQIDARLEQLGLVAQEAEIINRLDKEIKQLRDREKTDLEKQVELLNLISQEIKAQVSEAKANFVLQSGTSTELEKQEARLTLINEGLERQQRIAKVIELGFSEEEITRLADLPITLKDIGEEAKGVMDDAGEAAADLLGISEGMIELTQEWLEGLEAARQKWFEIKEEAVAALNAINDNLPDWLKILPEKQGGVAPIVDTLQTTQKWILGVGAAFVATNLISKLVTLRNLLWSTAAVSAGAAGVGAAASGPTIFGKLLIAGGLGFGLGKIVAELVAGESTITQATQGLSGALDRIEDEFGVVRAREIENRIAEFTSSLSTLSDDDQLRLSSAIANRIVIGFESGHSTETITNSINNMIEGAITGVGTLESHPEVEKLASSFSTSLIEAINSPTELAVVNPANLFSTDIPDADPQTLLLRQNLAIWAGNLFGDATAGEISMGMTESIAAGTQNLLEDEAFKNALGEKFTTLISQGLSAGEAAVEVTNWLNQGVSQGFIPNTPENKKSAIDFVNGLVALLMEAGGIRSPSTVTKTKVGVPMGQGVIKGFEAVLPTIAKSKILADFILTLQKKFIQIRKEAEAEFVLMKDNLLITLVELQRETETIMSNLHTAMIANGFTKIRLGIEVEVGLIRTNVVNTLAGETNSMLSDLRDKLLGATGSLAEDSPAWQIGKNFVAGMAKGVEDNAELLKDAVLEGLADALKAGAALLEAGSPSELAARLLGLPISEGAAKGVRDGAGILNDAIRSTFSNSVQSARPALAPTRATALPSSVRNAYNSVTYQLTVVTDRTSQGVVGDFEAMSLMRPG